MRERFEMGLYNLLSKDKRISRFREFHDIEAKTIVIFLMQVGIETEEMEKNLKKMLCLNEKIWLKKTHITYMQNNELNIEEVPLNLETIEEEINEYNRLKDILQEYIERVDKTENKEVVSAFSSLVLYEQNILKLYEEVAKDKTRILELFKEIIT